MKRILHIILCLVLGNAAWSQTALKLKDGTASSGIVRTEPGRDVKVTSDGVLVTYNIDNAQIVEDGLYPGCYWWKIDGFGFEESEGKPSVLYRQDSFSIPDGHTAKVEIVETSYKDFNYPLTPAHPALTDSGDEVYTRDNVPPVEASLGVYPASAVTDNGFKSYRRTRIFNVLVSPLQHLGASGKVRAYSKIVYKVTFTPTSSTKERMTLPRPYIDDIFLSNITLNDSVQQIDNLVSASVPVNQDYLIISTSKYKDAVEKFAHWKRRLGYRVHIALKDKWSNDSEVKQCVEWHYRTYPALQYLLIIGDIEDVPSSYSSLKNSHYTDYYYGCMDGESNYLPDIFRGRLSVSTLEEAFVVVNKIINYEWNPVTDPSFYKNGVNCAEFQDDYILDKNWNRIPPDSYEDRRFTKTCEDIRDYLMSFGKNIKRIYYTEDRVTPLYWNNGIYSNGESIPDELKKPQFKWNGNASDINAAIGEGAFYVLHRDHGEIYGWSHPEYKNANLDALNNGDKLPVVFSLNCLTGKFNIPVCFSEKFLRKRNGGCVAIFGATEISYSGYNDVLAGGMFDAIWPSPGLRILNPGQSSTDKTPEPTYKLGQILDQGLARMGEVYINATGNEYNKLIYTKELFHCFGDPSMQIYTDTPTYFKGVECTRDNDRVIVNTHDPNAIVSFYNQATDEIACYKGMLVTHKTNHPASIMVTVSGHNKIPHTFYGTEPSTTYIQNATVNGDATFTDDVIKIGHNVTDTRDAGPVVFQGGQIVLNAREVIIESNTTVNKNTEFIIEPK